MFYRIAIRRVADPQGQSPLWKWFSTTLASLNSGLLFFNYYHALPLERMRVFSASSREELIEQLASENKGLGSNSVPAAQFLRERSIHVRETTPEESFHEAQERREPATIGSARKRPCNRQPTESRPCIC